jgi:hypothetical protein
LLKLQVLLRLDGYVFAEDDNGVMCWTTFLHERPSKDDGEMLEPLSAMRSLGWPREGTILRASRCRVDCKTAATELAPFLCDDGTLLSFGVTLPLPGKGEDTQTMLPRSLSFAFGCWTPSYLRRGRFN